MFIINGCIELDEFCYLKTIKCFCFIGNNDDWFSSLCCYWGGGKKVKAANITWDKVSRVKFL